MTHVTCMPTAKNRDQLRNRTLSSPVLATFIFIALVPGCCCWSWWWYCRSVVMAVTHVAVQWRGRRRRRRRLIDERSVVQRRRRRSNHVGHGVGATGDHRSPRRARSCVDLMALRLGAAGVHDSRISQPQTVATGLCIINECATLVIHRTRDGLVILTEHSSTRQKNRLKGPFKNYATFSVFLTLSPAVTRLNTPPLKNYVTVKQPLARITALFHSRLKSFLFCKSFLPRPFLFLLRDSLYGFPRLFTVTSEHIRLFYFLVFVCFYTFLVVGSVR